MAPDFSIIALVILALAAGPVPATLGGFVLGLVQDLSNPTLLGLQALCKTPAGFGLGRLRGRLVYGMPLVEATVVGLGGAGPRLRLPAGPEQPHRRGASCCPCSPRPCRWPSTPGLVGIPLLRLAELLGILRQED